MESKVNPGVGTVHVKVTITLPDGHSQTFNLVQAFMEETQRLVLKDLVEISVEKAGTYLRRNWENEVKPWLDLYAPEKAPNNDNTDSSRL